MLTVILRRLVVEATLVMFGFAANAFVFCSLILAVVGEEFIVLPFGDAKMNPKPVLLLVLLPVPVAVPVVAPVAGPLLSAIGETTMLLGL